MAYKKISVNEVYQKVLALANKEQRGYITPQEFNLFADQAQLEIFENYFYDLNIARLKPKNNTDTSDEIEMLNEKISIHRNVSGSISKASDEYALPADLYSLTSVYFTNNGLPVNIPEVDRVELDSILHNSLSKPILTRPIFTRVDSGGVEILPSTFASDVNMRFIERPASPDWGYVVVNNKALYNVNTSTDFDLHPSEENDLVFRILELAGVSMKDQNLTELALRDKANTKAEKNN